jgi:DNA-binding MarR family transcriptional regulator
MTTSVDTPSLGAGDVLFGECTAYKARQLSRKVNAHFDAYIAPLGLKMTQFALLGFVWRYGPLKSSELARYMDLDASTLSRNVQPMMAQNWLMMDSGSDARSRLIGLTPEGRRLFKRAGQRWQQAQHDLRQQLGQNFSDALHTLLDQSLTTLASMK